MPPPPASRPAGFSAGPAERKDGSSASNNGITLLNVPGLTVRGGPKDDQPTLMAHLLPANVEGESAGRGSHHRRRAGREHALRNQGPRASPKRPTRISPAAWSTRSRSRCRTSPATREAGWSGSPSASRCPGAPPPDMRAPVPLRKVDPKYVAAAAAERVEGTIRLAGGDPQGRACRAASRCSAIWMTGWIAPPRKRSRNGSSRRPCATARAVDVDAVFEIPFRLAPRPHEMTPTVPDH